MDEFYLINNYFKKIAKNNLNDDVFFDKKNKLVVSVDTYNEGIHFPNFKNPDLVIKKVIRSSISDLIAKGVKPVYYFISGSGNKKKFTKKNLLLLINSLSNEQKKYKLKLSGGDTTVSKKISFSITTIGFSNKVIERNKVKLHDDIYVTGNLGDSFVGLMIIKKKIKINKPFSKYFVNKYFSPDIPFKLTNYLHKFANSSMDVSDGIISDMYKLINKQKLSFLIDLDKLPISKNLSYFLKQHKFKKDSIIFHGDDYQTLFTANKNKRRLIKSISKKINQKITLIGKIQENHKLNTLKSQNSALNMRKFKGYSHKF